MANEKIPVGDTYDYTKSIINIELNPSLIHGLEQTILLLVLHSINDPIKVKESFKKMNSILSEEIEIDKANLTDIESSILTLLIIQNTLKFKALEQNLLIKSNKTINSDDAEKLFAAYINQDEKVIDEYVNKIKTDLS